MPTVSSPAGRGNCTFARETREAHKENVPLADSLLRLHAPEPDLAVIELGALPKSSIGGQKDSNCLHLHTLERASVDWSTLEASVIAESSMDATDAFFLLQNRASSTNDAACPCVNAPFGAAADCKEAPGGEDKAPIEAHKDLLGLKASELVREFKRLQEDRVRVFGLFERFDPPRTTLPHRWRHLPDSGTMWPWASAGRSRSS